MRVNDSSSSGISGLNRTDPGSSGAGSKIRGGRFDRDDQVSLSNLSSAMNALETDSPERSARLSSLSAAIMSGSYQVDPSALSGALIHQSMRA
jgi:anti-sigma28 factor (negative regulator of flagellin synthesis)